MSMSSTTPGALATTAAKLVTVEFHGDEDIATFASLYRDFWILAADLSDLGSDSLYTSLWFYDKEHKRFGSTRAERVVRPLRGIGDHARLAHRASMTMVGKYNREYAEDIAMNSKGAKRPAFRPGDKAA